MQRLVIMKAMALRILMASPATMIQMPRVYHSSYSNNPVQEHVVNTMLYHPHDPAPLPFSLLSFENPKRACMPALVICSVCGACGHILRHARCLQPTFYRACGACGEEEDACNPRFTVPAVPAAKEAPAIQFARKSNVRRKLDPV